MVGEFRGWKLLGCRYFNGITLISYDEDDWPATRPCITASPRRFQDEIGGCPKEKFSLKEEGEEILERGFAPLLPALPLPLIREGGQGDRSPKY